jgi:hypothetical protein
LIPDDRRGVWGLKGAVDGAARASCGVTDEARDEARDQEGEAVVDRSDCGAEGARDQPNNDVRIAVEDGSGGGDDLVIGGSPSLATSDSVCSLMERSSSTDAMTPNRLFSCVEDFKKAIRKRTSLKVSQLYQRVLDLYVF